LSSSVKLRYARFYYSLVTQHTQNIYNYLHNTHSNKLDTANVNTSHVDAINQ